MSIETKMISDLLRLADAIMAFNPNIRISLLSYHVVGRTSALATLRDGGVLVPRLTGREYDDALQSFSDNWPDQLPWPKGINRPEQSKNRSIWPKPRRHLTVEQRAAIAREYAAGVSLAEIADRYDVDYSYPTVIAKRAGLTLRNPL